MPPARFGWHPENTQRAVLVRIFGVGALRFLDFQLRVLLLERVGNVLEKKQTEDNVLVLGGIHAAAQRVRHLPKLGFVTDIGSIVWLLFLIAFCLCHNRTYWKTIG